MNNEKFILIAEDDELNYQILKGFLRKYNITIIWTKNGWDTFVYCIKKNIHLVLMDIKMPIMDGLQATYLIKKHRPETIIIAQTAYSMYGDKEMCLEAGCDDYISKPIDFKLLSQKLDKYILAQKVSYK